MISTFNLNKQTKNRHKGHLSLGLRQSSRVWSQAVETVSHSPVSLPVLPLNPLSNMSSSLCGPGADPRHPCHCLVVNTSLPIPALQTAAHILAHILNPSRSAMGVSPKPRVAYFLLACSIRYNSTVWKIWSFHGMVSTFHGWERGMEWYKKSHREYRDGN